MADTSIGVLLPLRLETRFYEPGVAQAGDTWTLKVRIVPDAANLDRHNPLPTPAELDTVEALWNAVGGTVAGLTTENGKAQWRVFSARIGAARLAWLVRTFPATAGADGVWRVERPAQLSEPLTFARVAGLPRTLELWLGRGGAAPERVADLAVDVDLLALDLADPEAGDTRWWSSFEHAKRAGLGAELDVGKDRPDDIDVLYVVGLGEDNPAALFEAHRDAGILGIAALGEATNSVDGAPAANLAQDPETWRTLLTGPPPQPGAEAMSRALTGKPETLGALPGGEGSDAGLEQALVASLWSVLWGHWIKDVWLAGDVRALDAGVWAAENLVPHGAVPSLRVGDQPYGVLPVTAFARWVPGPNDPWAGIEEQVLRIGLSARDVAAQAAEAAGTSVGASTQRLLDLIAQVPTSRAYAWRWMLPLETLYLLHWTFGNGISWPRLAQWWDDLSRPARAVAGVGSPSRRYATLGEPQDLQLPLVVPTNIEEQGLTLDDVIKRLIEVSPGRLASDGVIRELFSPMPDSLLFRLLVHARLVDAAEVVRLAQRAKGPLLKPIQALSSDPTELARWGSQFEEGLVGGDPASLVLRMGRDATANLLGQDPQALERAFRAILDTASHRVDPWLTGVAARRLRELTYSGAGQFRLGAYGWVDAPRPRDAGAAIRAEYLHAPSMEQALTAAILRDHHLSDSDLADAVGAPDEASRWHMDLDSDRIRQAGEIAEEVRLGAHLSEVLGRAVERAVASKADVERLRAAFPIRTEHAGRRVCDGKAVLAQYVANPAVLGLGAAQLAAFEPLARAVDTYGDLLVAEGVFDVVSGRTAMAAAAMDAAAGLGAPPSLEVLATRRGGRTARSTVLAAIPDAPAPAGADAFTSPGALAEPAVAAAIEAQTGGAGDAAWTWAALDAGGVLVGTTTLADVGLAPVDTLSLSAADLQRLALAVAPAGTAVLTPAQLPGHAAALRLSDILGSRPAVPGDLVTGGQSADDPALVALHSSVQAELAARYAAVHALAGDLQAALVAAVPNPADHARALLGAARWGITPLAQDGAPPATLVTRAAAALTDRLSKAPTPAEASALAPAVLARELAELVSPEGRLPVLSRVPLDQLPTPLVPDIAAGPDAVDEGWLEVVASVRAHLARVEAYQFGREVGGLDRLATWTNRPGDPWQSADAPAAAGPVAETHLLAAFGPAGALDGGGGARVHVALGLIDSFSEVIPATDHATTAAVHVDAPGSRAPQAVLIAVPPDVDRPLDTETLVEILADTRLAARARAATPGDLDALAAGEPFMFLPVGQPTGISLEPK